MSSKSIHFRHFLTHESQISIDATELQCPGREMVLGRILAETIPQTFLSKRLWFSTEHLSYKDLWVLLFPEWYHAVLGLG